MHTILGTLASRARLCALRGTRHPRLSDPSSSEQTAITGGSMFNVKARSLRLGDFTEADVSALLGQHTEETGQTFTSEALDTVWTQTRGQPWLANALCAEACFGAEAEHDRLRAITSDDILDAQEQLILRRETPSISSPTSRRKTGCGAWSSRC